MKIISSSTIFRLHIFTMAIIFVFSIASVFAGTKDGGGGAAVVYRDEAGIITRAELIDLMEPHKLCDSSPVQDLNVPDGSNLKDSLDSARYKLSTNKISAGQKMLIDRMVYLARDDAYYLPPGSKLPIENDMFTVPGVSRPAQYFAYYDTSEEEGVLYVLKEIFDRLPPSHQAAFFYHEALYRMARKYKQVDNSFKTRELVHLIFHPTAYCIYHEPEVPGDHSWNIELLNLLMNKNIASEAQIILDQHSQLDQYYAWVGSSAGLPNFRLFFEKVDLLNARASIRIEKGVLKDDFTWIPETIERKELQCVELWEGVHIQPQSDKTGSDNYRSSYPVLCRVPRGPIAPFPQDGIFLGFGHLYDGTRSLYLPVMNGYDSSYLEPSALQMQISCNNQWSTTELCFSNIGVRSGWPYIR